MIDNIMVQMPNSNGELVNKYMTDTDAKRAVFSVTARSIFDRIAETPQLNLVYQSRTKQPHKTATRRKIMDPSAGHSGRYQRYCPHPVSTCAAPADVAVS